VSIQRKDTATAQSVTRTLSENASGSASMFRARPWATRFFGVIEGTVLPAEVLP